MGWESAPIVLATSEPPRPPPGNRRPLRPHVHVGALASVCRSVPEGNVLRPIAARVVADPSTNQAFARLLWSL
ncbi:hypothetical protein GCM10009624_16690 [Gordonia sinesedis]